MKRLLSLVALVCALVSCNNTKKPLLPNVSGKAGEVIVMLDKSEWEGNLGSGVRELLACECPWLATREPLFSLVNVTPSNFIDMFKVHRNILYFEINPQIQKEGVVFRRDMWASPQCVIQVSAYDSESALNLIRENGEKIQNAIEQAERDRIINNSILYEEKDIAVQVREVMGGSPHFPIGYQLKLKTDDFIWVADEKQYTNQGILIYKYPVEGTDEFELETLIKHRNEILQENVPGMFENTYMTTADYISPTVKYVKYKGLDFAETRGFWEVYNDFMGGPFVSHSFYSRDGKEIIVLDAFVYAPKYDKRQYLRQVESIIYSFEWEKEEE